MEGVIAGCATSRAFLQWSLSSPVEGNKILASCAGVAGQAPRLQQRRLGVVHASLGAATADPKQAISGPTACS